MVSFENNTITNLTSREKEILLHILQGFTKRQISETLCLSFNTVDTHFRHIYGKFGVNSKTELLLKLVESKSLMTK